MTQPPPRRKKQPPRHQQSVVPELPPKQRPKRKPRRAANRAYSALPEPVGRSTTYADTSSSEPARVAWIADPLRTLQRCVLARFVLMPVTGILVAVTHTPGAEQPDLVVTVVVLALALPLLLLTFLSAINLARAVGRDSAFDWLVIFLAIVPLGGLMTIFYLINTATEILETYGYRISLWGHVSRIVPLNLDQNERAMVRSCRFGMIAVMILPISIMIAGVVFNVDAMNSMPRRTPEQAAAADANVVRIMVLYLVLPWLLGGIAGFVTSFLATRTLRWSPILGVGLSVLASIPFANIVVLFILQSKVGTELKRI